MTVQTFYRWAVWVPLIVPGVVAIAVHLVGLRPDDGPLLKPVQVLRMSGVYGGLPYALLAAWGTWWIDSRPEPEIRRRALIAPLLMLGVWIAFATILGGLARSVAMFAGLTGLGAVMILSLGYIYVALVFLLRHWLRLADGTR